MGEIFEGKVMGGNKIGRKLGFPTANMEAADEALSPDGVYAAMVVFEGRTYEGMAWLGRKPSLSGPGRRILEVNIFDFSQDIYDRNIKVELVSYIRPDRRFDSMEELCRAITDDRQEILKYFNNVYRSNPAL